ncbi:helix-turn-helix domain-containing protein [Spirosoma sp. SC4-14]|uniref:helix-turn-helix domain-containing protein n=1 Tax=Spirosoma sp. SC4-14 TaxID=3128900 RepID=UPI0030CD81C0
MDSLWIDEEIMALKRTPAERFLLARICYRAGMNPAGICVDSNKELSQAIDIHPQTVSDLVRTLEKAGLISTKIFPEKKNLRTIQPIRKILIPYKNKADRYKEKADSDYKEFPYSPSESDMPLSGNSLDPIRKNLRPYKEIPDSLYKDRELIENSEENPIASSSSSGAGEAVGMNQSNLPAEEKPPTPPVAAAPLSPKKKYGDGKLQELVKRFIRDNPDKYPVEMYVNFLEKWTAKVDNATNSAHIGQELWYTQDKFILKSRLENWYPGYLKDQQKQQNEPATRNTQSNHSAGQKGTSISGKQSKKLALIPPGSLSRVGQNRGNADRSGDGRTVRIDVE